MTSWVTYLASDVLIAYAEQLGEQLIAGAWKSLISFFYWLLVIYLASEFKGQASVAIH